jgi:hypothetical protein
MKLRLNHQASSEPAEIIWSILNCGESNMRSIAFVLGTFLLVTFVASAPAAAQGWEEYSYPEYAFSVSFPEKPRVETTTYQVADSRAVPAHVYSVRQGSTVFTMTVADLAGANLDERAVIDHVIKTLSQGGKVGINIPARIYRSYGRHITVEYADGSRSMVSIFDIAGRLYLIEAKGPPGASEFELTRFQQSLVFDREITNRTAEEVQAIRAACPGLAGILNGAGNPVTPAGKDDPRCQVAAPQPVSGRP